MYKQIFPLDIIKKHGIDNLGDSDGSCPCTHFRIGGINVEIHCWRVGNCCEFSGVHVWRDDGRKTKMLEDIAEEVLLQIIDVWGNTTEFEVVYGPREFGTNKRRTKRCRNSH